MAASRSSLCVPIESIFSSRLKWFSSGREVASLTGSIRRVDVVFNFCKMTSRYWFLFIVEFSYYSLAKNLFVDLIESLNSWSWQGKGNKELFSDEIFIDMKNTVNELGGEGEPLGCCCPGGFQTYPQRLPPPPSTGVEGKEK